MEAIIPTEIGMPIAKIAVQDQMDNELNSKEIKFNNLNFLKMKFNHI